MFLNRILAVAKSQHIQKYTKNLLFLRNSPNKSISIFPKANKFCSQCENPPTEECSKEETNAQNKKPATFRHAYPEELEGGVNSQILAEFNASMTYLSLSCYYGRTDIAMPGCQIFFKMLYQEEQHHALDFINYQLLRGGVVKLFPITVPENSDWHDITISLAIALELEKRVKEKLEDLFCIAEEHNDMQLMDLISGDYMKDQNTAIWELGRLLTRAKRLVHDGSGVGRHLFDKEIFNYVSQKLPAGHLDTKHYI